MTNKYLYVLNVVTNVIFNSLEALCNFKSEEYIILGKNHKVNLNFCPVDNL
jgi:hypothetical protein